MIAMKYELVWFIVGYMLILGFIQFIPVILVYPDENHVIYRDDRDTCYKYRRVTTDCPKTQTSVKSDEV